ncbi:MAG: hypothetical protein ACOYOA_11900, partial [Saprospiraceae bacterium]
MRHFLFILLLLIGFSSFAQTKKSKSAPTHPANTYSIAPMIKAPSIPGNAVETGSSPFTDFKSIKADFHPILGRDIEILRDANGDVIMVKGSNDRSISGNRSAQDKIKAYLDGIQQEIGFAAMSNDFQLKETSKDELGMEHFKMQQVFNGIPVYGAEIILHSSEGEINLMNGRF